ncbi:MAG TPA: hypothetical protein VK638_29035, partial [Edaphobacter sp.]|nr:hypothetical protein [Edaphobacter sp.]
FIEHDSAGNIVHVCADPMATIVPLINRVTYRNPDGTPLVDAQGRDLSPFGSPLLEPVGIDSATYIDLIADGMENYIFDDASGKPVKRTATNAQAA